MMKLRVLGQRVIGRQNCAAGIAKDDIDALADKTLEQDFCSIQDHAAHSINWLALGQAAAFMTFAPASASR